MDVKCIHKPLSTNRLLFLTWFLFFFPSAGNFPCAIPLIFILPSLKLLQKSFPTSIIFLPSICQAFLKSPVLGCSSSHSECNIISVCWHKPILRTGIYFHHYQVKMTSLKSIPSLVRVKGIWEKSMVQIIKDLGMTTWSEALESQTGLKNILPLCKWCL